VRAYVHITTHVSTFEFNNNKSPCAKGVVSSSFVVVASSQVALWWRCVAVSALFMESSETTRKFIATEEKYGAMNYHPMPVVIASARGCMMTDVDGKEYYDMLAAVSRRISRRFNLTRRLRSRIVFQYIDVRQYSAVNQGHLHPKIMAAFREQSEKLTLTSRAFFNDTLGEYAKYASEVFGYQRLLPMNSGAEAVETAVKLARRW
jgi:ornithine--oxo-acid transaminase